VWFAASVLNVGLCKGTTVKLIWINFGFFCLFMGATELYFLFQISEASVRPPVTQEGTTANLSRRDDRLGYAPNANVTITDRKLSGGDLMWDVTYTIDSRGLRVTPQPENQIECILFFGGSVTFGEGINDEETMPYQVGRMLQKDVKVFNFGVGGYGAHQMLAALEHGLVEDVVDCDRETVGHVVYQGIWQHTARVAGIAPWDDHGPRYELDENGVAVYRGQFDDGFRKILRPMVKTAQKSAIYKRIFGRWHYFRRLNFNDFDRYVAVVSRAQEMIQERYPCAKFHILFWDTLKRQNDEILVRFAARGLQSHRVSTILPGYNDPEAGLIYKIHPDDGHPNAVANARVANYLVDNVFSVEATCAQSDIDPQEAD
jgi:hypothetical protein